MRALLAAIVVLAVAGPAHAEGAARHAYDSGNYMVAAQLAERGGGDRALAAQALIAAAVTARDADIDALVARAEANARAGVAADRNDVDARIQLALALGLKGRRASLREAVRHGYAREGRALIDDIVRRAPDSAWAHALDGAWHLEVLRRGGVIGARLYGARRDDGIAAFERARALAPDDAAIAYQYAIALLELDGPRYAARARALLADASACRAQDAFEAAIAAEARTVAKVLASQGAAAAARAATRRMG